jgi:uncharacterized protein YegP (UPF0339 family)
MAGKFEIYRDKAGEYRFRLKAGNGEIILSSEGYSGKSSARNGVQSVQKNCTDPACFTKRSTKGGRYRFDLLARNKQVIGTSGNYKSSSGRNNGIKAVGRAAKGAKIVDLTA